VTSAESFIEVHRFLTGRSPRTTRIVPEPPGHLRLSGRAVLFPLNVGVPDATLEIWEVGALTGRREHKRPEAVYSIGGDGSWGPFKAKPHARYEFAIVRAGASTHHFYYQPFRRSDRLIRLNTATPGGGLGSRTEVSEATTNLVISRNKEWWGDQGEGSDRLWVNGTDILNPANAPRAKRVIAMFAYDAGLDGVTDLSAPLPFFFGQPFITGMDVHLPSSGTTWVLARQRGTGELDLLGVPAWPSASHQISLQFNDYP
jgi:hypothetical protein